MVKRRVLFGSGRIVVWDTEYTSWEGCQEHGWDPAKDQYRELVQIGAVIVDTKDFSIVNELFLLKNG